MTDEKTTSLLAPKPAEHTHVHPSALHEHTAPHTHTTTQSRDFHHHRASAIDYHEKKKGIVHKLASKNYNTRIWAPFDKLERWKKIATGLIVAIAIVHLWWGVWGILDHYLIPETRPINYITGIAIGLFILLLTGEIIEGGGR